MQVTLARAVAFDGIGVHSGAPVHMRVEPGAPDSGIVFWRSDLPAAAARIPVGPASWSEARLHTRLVNAHGARVGTIEHLMAALAGCGIHNARIVLDAPEVPILDGSAAPFVHRFLAAGLRMQDAPLKVIEVLRPVTLRDGDAVARLDPSEQVRMTFSIAFPDAAIGAQSLSLDLANGAFVRELGNCRTFCRRADVERMRAAGLGLGGSLDNAVVVDGAQVLTPGGMRRRDEPVRHKMLDALGDLAVAGRPILGHYTGVRAGHALTGRLLRALLADPANYRLVTADAAMHERLPGGLCLGQGMALSA